MRPDNRQSTILTAEDVEIGKVGLSRMPRKPWAPHYPALSFGSGMQNCCICYSEYSITLPTQNHNPDMVLNKEGIRLQIISKIILLCVRKTSE